MFPSCGLRLTIEPNVAIGLPVVESAKEVYEVHFLRHISIFEEIRPCN